MPARFALQVMGSNTSTSRGILLQPRDDALPGAYVPAAQAWMWGGVWENRIRTLHPCTPDMTSACRLRVSSPCDANARSRAAATVAARDSSPTASRATGWQRTSSRVYGAIHGSTEASERDLSVGPTHRCVPAACDRPWPLYPLIDPASARRVTAWATETHKRAPGM